MASNVIFALFQEDEAGLPSGSAVKNPPAMQETQETRAGFLEEEMATHSNRLAWRIPRTKEPSGLHSKGLQRVRHAWRDSAQQGTQNCPLQMEGNSGDFSREKTSFLLVSVLVEIAYQASNQTKSWVYFVPVGAINTWWHKSGTYQREFSFTHQGSMEQVLRFTWADRLPLSSKK